jgi:hypothetical protein
MMQAARPADLMPRVKESLEKDYTSGCRPAISTLALELRTPGIGLGRPAATDYRFEPGSDRRVPAMLQCGNPSGSPG